MIGLIPAAGAGTRFKELGKMYSKTILPYKEKPILIHQIEWLEKHGCTDIRVVLNHQEDSVKEILKMYNKNVSTFKQETRNGLSGAIHAGTFKNDNDSILILLGDLVINEKIEENKFVNNFISVQNVQDYSRWCMVQDITGDGNLEFFDKPNVRPDTNLAVSGVYYFKDCKKLHKLLSLQLHHDNYKINGEFQLSTVMQWISDKEKIFLVDLKIINFGTLDEYLQNRSVKNSRSFNDIVVDGQFITKSSEDAREKIIDEYNWFSNLPEDISIMTPRIFNKDLFSYRTWYKMEKILAPSLRECYLFLDSTEETWESIFTSLFTTLDSMEKYGQKNKFMSSVYNKTVNRVKDINIAIENKLVNDFLSILKTNIDKFDRPSLMHGDFCFSNLLYDFHSNKITMIDPRGELFGDHYYEIAKLFHSVIYDYDFVDTELYVMQDDKYKLYNNGKENIKKIFLKHIDLLYTKKEINYIKIICASLFLSMIPLHNHNKNNQKIYFNIFKTIYKEIKE